MRQSCPGCGARLNVPRGFQRGTCPACKARVANPAGRRRSAGAASHQYEAFHGAAPRQVRKVQLKLPSEWWLLGSVKAVEYGPPSHSERAGEVFRHDFGDTGHGRQKSNAGLYSSPDGRWLLIPAGNFRVSTARGIVG